MIVKAHGLRQLFARAIAPLTVPREGGRPGVRKPRVVDHFLLLGIHAFCHRDCRCVENFRAFLFVYTPASPAGTT